MKPRAGGAGQADVRSAESCGYPIRANAQWDWGANATDWVLSRQVGPREDLLQNGESSVKATMTLDWGMTVSIPQVAMRSPEDGFVGHEGMLKGTCRENRQLQFIDERGYRMVPRRLHGDWANHAKRAFAALTRCAHGPPEGSTTVCLATRLRNGLVAGVASEKVDPCLAFTRRRHRSKMTGSFSSLRASGGRVEVELIWNSGRGRIRGRRNLVRISREIGPFRIRCFTCRVKVQPRKSAGVRRERFGWERQFDAHAWLQRRNESGTSDKERSASRRRFRGLRKKARATRSRGGDHGG